MLNSELRKCFPPITISLKANTLRGLFILVIGNLGEKGNNGGWGGIRTHGGVTPSPVFKTGALNHSTTQPLSGRET